MKLLREKGFCQRKKEVGQYFTMFLNDFVAAKLLHISKLKSYENNVAEQNEQIKRLHNEILELVQIEEFDKKMNTIFLFNYKIYNLVSNIETCVALPY